MLYTMDSRFREIAENTEIREQMNVFFPQAFIDLVPEEMRDCSLYELEQKIRMPWGVPFLSDELMKAANAAVRSMEENLYVKEELWNGFGGRESAVLYIRKPEREGVLPAAVICPGGGYETHSVIGEGIQIMEDLSEKGYRTFMLLYRLGENRFPEPQKDLDLAVRTIRSRSEEFRIDPDQIITVGFSAGGHLVTTEAGLHEQLSQLVDEDLRSEDPERAAQIREISGRPDGVCSGYGFILFEDDDEGKKIAASHIGEGKEILPCHSAQNTVKADYPPAYVWTVEDDDLVPPAHSLTFAAALEENHLPHVMKMYPQGGHGCGNGKGTSADGWIDEMVRFMQENGIG